MLQKGLVVVESERFNMHDGRVRHWEESPRVARQTIASGEREKVVVTVGIAGGREGNSPQRTCAKDVGMSIVFKHVNVSTKLEAHT